MRLATKISTAILGTALAAAMATGQASASTNTSATTATSAKPTASPQVVDAFWFQTRFTYGSGPASEIACIIYGGVLKVEFPNDIDGTDCILQSGKYVLWLHGDDYVYGLFHA